MSSKREENGTVSRNANRTCTPVWTTRTSWRSSMRLRSRRSVSVSSRRGSTPTRGGASARMPSAALHPRAGDDVVAAVGPADPRLVAAVVVVAEKHERRRIAQGGAGLVALRIDPAPDADERVALPFGRDCRRLGVTRADDG